MFFLRKSAKLFLVASACAAFLTIASPARCNAEQYGAQTEAALERANRANTARNYTGALKEYKEASKIEHGTCFACYIGLTAVYGQLGDMHNADESADKAISTAKTAAERLLARVNRGSALMRFASADSKRAPAAEAEFRQVLSEDAANVEARYALGLCLLKQKKDDEGIRELKALVAGHPDPALARQAQLLISNPRRAREEFAPEFTVTTLQGQTISLRDLSGKVVVLDFWATWCPVCRESLPEIKDLVKKYPREKLEVISVSGDTSIVDWKNFVAAKGMDWPQVFSTNGGSRVAMDLHVHAFPTYIVLDGEGAVRERIVGTDPRKSIAFRLKDTLKGMKELE